MEIREEVNPVGAVISDGGIAEFIAAMKALWDATFVKPDWWKFWERVSMVPVTDFLMKCLDDLIAYVDQLVDTQGADKKATVLAAIGQIYDYIVKDALPFWLWPFATQVKGYIIDVLISAAIDWIVAKYRNGDWRKKPAPEIVAQWRAIRSLHGVPGGHRPQ